MFAITILSVTLHSLRQLLISVKLQKNSFLKKKTLSFQKTDKNSATGFFFTCVVILHTEEFICAARGNKIIFISIPALFPFSWCPTIWHSFSLCGVGFS